MILPEFIFIAQGTLGDLHPILGISVNLKKAGYGVTVIANEHFKSTLNQYEIDFLESGTEGEYQDGFGKAYSGISWRGYKAALENTLEKGIEREYNLIEERIKHNPKVIIVAHTSLNGGYFISKKYDLPFVKLIYAPSWIPSKHSPPWPFTSKEGFFSTSLGRKVFYPAIFNKQDKKSIQLKVGNRQRKKYGMPESDRFSLHDAEFNLGLALFPSWFAKKQDDWGENIHICGFPLFDKIDQDKRITVGNFIRENGPPILFTSGSGVENSDKFLKESIKICSAYRKPGIIVSRRSFNQFHDTKNGIAYVDYVDFEHILPKCLALVHHGGIGTTAQAIRAGLPQIIRPIIYDQPDNAYRIAKLGLGGMVFPKDYKEKKVIDILENLFFKPIHINARDYYSQLLNKENGIELVSKHLLTFADEI